MITALNPTAFEAGLKAYLDARFAAEEVVVPTLTAGAPGTPAAPQVLVGLSTEIVGISTITVALRSAIGQTEAAGWYTMEPIIVVVTPLKIDGLTLEHHSAVYDALLAAFPERPHGNASEEDKAAWAALHEELSECLNTACGYNAAGWITRSSIYRKSESQIEQPLVIRLGVVHPDV